MSELYHRFKRNVPASESRQFDRLRLRLLARCHDSGRLQLRTSATYHTCPSQLTLRRIMHINSHYGSKSCTLKPETVRNGSLIRGSPPHADLKRPKMLPKLEIRHVQNTNFYSLPAFQMTKASQVILPFV